MSHSVSPLGSLSSPSPSPPPNPIDESELSELTDDDHDQNIQIDAIPDNDNHQHPPPRPRKPTNASNNPRQRQRFPRKSLHAATYPSRSSAAPSSSKRKKRGGLVPAPMWDWAYKNGTNGSPSSTPTPALSPPINSTPGPSRPIDPDSEHALTPDAEEEEEEELPTVPRAMEEEEGEEGDPRKDRPLDRKHSQRKSLIPPPPPRRRVLLPYERRDSNSNDESDQSDNHVQSEDDDRSPSPVPSDDDGMDVDEDAEDQEPTPSRQSPTRPTLNTNLKPTPPPSTSAIDPAADNPSVPPSNRASFGSTATPPDEHTRPSAIPYEDVDQDHDPDALDEDDQHHAPDGDVEADGDEDDDPQPEEPSQPPSPTPLAEPEPEPEPEDEDPDLQPAHRAEALDVLATIELKFALLRERVYVEKMEGLAWEEALVWDGLYAMLSHYSQLIHLVASGTHPELHHLQNELTKRRDKRLMLASKKRTYEIEALARKRREEEAWCWEGWDITCTELQIEMIAETNRKRRKLERDRRTIERPPGARRVPNAILNPPPAPTLRQIANTFPLPSHLSHLAANKKLSNAKGLGVYPGLDGLSGATAYPDLPTLPPHDIAADLEFLFQHRRLGYGFGMGFGPPMGVPMGVGYNSTASGFGPAAMGFGGPTPNPGFVVNGLGGPAETYPPNPDPASLLEIMPLKSGDHHLHSVHLCHLDLPWHLH
ncbi:Sds3-like-domain-containing protein [Boletus edulis BED1]|uniref:Sds3-like-domain-containing protein n=1 Tax=Boletus edulis BED1 TaxID=1328754 RepID=A0AAD4GMC1_BOLED|nr:Sds3-like-domain-containing protein [Boletus edulis BED1]